MEALASIALHRLGAKAEAEAVLTALMKRAVVHKDLGLHWKDAYVASITCSKDVSYV